MNICCAYESVEHCQFQFNAFELGQTGDWGEMLEHIESEHGFLVKRYLKWGDIFEIRMESSELEATLKSPNPISWFRPTFYEIGNKGQSPSYVFVPFLNFEEDFEKHKALSFAFGVLTSEREAKRIPFKVNLLIEGQPKPIVCNEWGEDCIPNINWSMKPMDTKQLKMFLKIPKDNRPSFPYSIPISNIQQFYINRNGKFIVKVSFKNE